MKALLNLNKILFGTIILLTIGLVSCGDDDEEDSSMDNFQSDKCNMGQKATLALDITGIGTFNYTESASAISHATNSEGLGIDAVSMYIYWKDAVSGDSLAFDVTIENETLGLSTYNYNNGSFNGSVNFYVYTNGVLQDWYTFDDWETTIIDFEVYATNTNGGLEVDRLAFVDAMTSGTFSRSGAGTTHAFTSSYTICPEYK